MTRLLPLFLLAAGVALPATAQVMTPGKVWLNYSYGHVKQNYDQDGEPQDLTNLPTIQRAALGASYAVMQMGASNVYLGAELSFGSLRSEPDPNPANAEIGVGFKPQNLSVLAGFRAPMYGFRAGYMADIGSELTVNSATDVELPNSDGSDAVLLGANVEYPAGPLSITLGADYYLTLNQEQSTTLTVTTNPALNGTYTLSYDSDPADYLDGYLGAAYNVTPSLELGLTARWHQRFAGEVGAATAEGGAAAAQNAGVASAVNAGLIAQPGRRPAEEEGHALLVVPHIKYSVSSLSFRLSGGTIREYAPYGFSLLGENSPVGRQGVTVGLTYGF